LKEGVGYYTYSEEEVKRKEDEAYEKLKEEAEKKGVEVRRDDVSVLFPYAFVDIEIPNRPAEYVDLLDLRSAAVRLVTRR
jgi:hypothetical protein